MAKKIATDNSDVVKKVLHENIMQVLEAIGRNTERNATENLTHDPRRIDTGRLYNSITHEGVIRDKLSKLERLSSMNCMLNSERTKWHRFIF